MNAQQLLDRILLLLHSVKDDEKKLSILLDFMEEELYSDEENEDCEGDCIEQLPEKFKKAVSEIADNMTAGLISYLNLDTGEVEDVPEMAANDPDEYELMTGTTFEDLNLKNQAWRHCAEIRPLGSCKSFEIMENFVRQLRNKKEAGKLAQVLSGRKPFANFNHLIHNSGCRQEWFDFQQKELEKYVIRNYLHEYK